MDDDDDGSENVAKKMNLLPGVELLRTLSRFRKRMENSMSYVHVLLITSHFTS